MKMQKNPWADFEYSDFMVHQLDADAVQEHNRIATKNFKFIPFLTPEPWIGNPDANVVILLANPGATKENIDGQRETNPFREKLSIANLHGESMQYPHYFLDPRLESDPGGKWWRAALGTLIKETSLDQVANSVMSLEALPYHSGNFALPAKPIATQAFTFQLLRDAMARQAFIVIYRQPEYWLENVPELAGYKHKTMDPNTTQRVWITPGNLKNGFDEILEKIKNQ
jgi:hypothetical protein